MKRWKAIRAWTAVLERIARCMGSGTDAVKANDAVCGPGAARKAGGLTEGRSEIGGFDNGGGADKSGGCGAGRETDDAGTAGPAAVTERRPHRPDDCGHHIMLPCAARRAMLGRGLPGAEARRRRDGDGRVGGRIQ